MGKQRYAFTPKGVLRLVDWVLIRDYFSFRGLLTGLSCLQLDEPDLEALHAAILNLPSPDRVSVEQDLQDLYDLADEDGLTLIYEEALHRGEDLTAVLTEYDTPHNAATWCLINRETFFLDLVKLRSADSLTQRYWRRRKGVPAVEPDTRASAKMRLSRQLSDYLVRSEGRGHRCHVECVERSTGYLFVAYPEDYGETVLEYEGEELIRRKIRPARDLLFFYAPEKGILEVFSQGSRQKIDDLQQIFALVVLGVPLLPDEASQRTYKLDPLLRPDFAFVFDSSSGLAEVVVKWVHLRDTNGWRGLTLEVEGPPGRGILAAAEKFFSVDPGQRTDKYPLQLMEIDRVKFQAHFRPVGLKRRGRSKTFTVSQFGCLLDHEGRDGILRKLLSDSGLEAPDKVLSGA
jgi:hypothetical protein